MQADSLGTLFRLEVTAHGVGDHRVQFGERISLRSDTTPARCVPACDVTAGFCTRLNLENNLSNRAHPGRLSAGRIGVNAAKWNLPQSRRPAEMQLYDAAYRNWCFIEGQPWRHSTGRSGTLRKNPACLCSLSIFDHGNCRLTRPASPRESRRCKRPARDDRASGPRNARGLAGHTTSRRARFSFPPSSARCARRGHRRDRADRS